MQYIVYMMIFFSGIALLSIIFEDSVKILNNATAKFIGLLAIFVYLWFVFNRPYSFRDTKTYQSIYESAQWSHLLNFNLMEREPKTGMEYGFLILMLIFRDFCISFRLFSTIISVFFLGTCYKFTKFIFNRASTYFYHHSKYFTFFLFFGIYLSYFGTFYNFVAIRACICIAFLLISSYFAIEKKPIYMVVMFLIAFSMQRFAILGLIPIYIFLVWNKKLSARQFRIIWIILGVFIIISYVYQNIIFIKVWGIVGKLIKGFYDFKFDKQNLSITRGFLYGAYWFTGLIIYKGKRTDQISNKITWIYLCGLILCVLFSGYASAYRIIDFMYIFTIPLTYSIFYNWKGNRLSKKIIYLVQHMLFFAIMTKYYIFWYLYG